MWNKPRELANYPGHGYENVHGRAYRYQANAKSASEAWKRSRSHNAVILNRGKWKDLHWQAIGVGNIDGFAAIWFGEETDPVQQHH